MGTAATQTNLPVSSITLIRGKTIEQAGAAGALEVRLAATAFRSAGRVRGIPRPALDSVLNALPVDVAEHGGALGAARPVLACAVLAGREGAAFHGRTGEGVVLIWRVAAPFDHVALFGQRGLLGEIVGQAVQFVHVLGDDHALGVLPWTVADAL